MLYTMKIPIFIDLEDKLNNLNSNEFNLNEEDPLNIYIDPLTIAPPPIPPINTDIPFILAPRYYILIRSPLDQNLPTLKIKIHKSDASLLKNKARVLLEPSLSYGINSCYTVEYWEWVPNLNLPAQISKRKLFSEYWFVPLLDNNYIPQYPYHLYSTNYQYENPYYNYPRLTSKKVNVLREINTSNSQQTLIEDVISNIEYTNIFAFPKDSYVSFNETIITEDLNFNEETKTWNFSKALVSSTLVRKLENVDGDLVNGSTTTTIEYIEPFQPFQLLLN